MARWIGLVLGLPLAVRIIWIVSVCALYTAITGGRPPVMRASILVAGRNFGSGSSREHAVWALADFGFRCIIAEAYSDIFYNNCFKNGVLPIVLDGSIVRQLMDAKSAHPDYQLTVDLASQTIRDEAGFEQSFEIDPVRKDSLLHGLDDIDLTLKHVDRIDEFEAARGMPPVSAA